MAQYGLMVEANTMGLWQVTDLESDVALGMFPDKSEAVTSARADGRRFLVIDEHIDRSNADGTWSRIDWSTKTGYQGYRSRAAAIAAARTAGTTAVAFRGDGTFELIVP